MSKTQRPVEVGINGFHNPSLYLSNHDPASPLTAFVASCHSDSNARFLALAWNAFVTAAERLHVDPIQLAEALGEGRLGALLMVRGKPWESDPQFAEALERLVHLPKLEESK